MIKKPHRKTSFEKKILAALKKKRKRKFNNTYCYIGKKMFHSKLERTRFIFLYGLQKKGIIKQLACQVRYPLEKNKTYVSDFTYFFENQRVVEDVKCKAVYLFQNFGSKKKEFEKKYKCPLLVVFQKDVLKTPQYLLSKLPVSNLLTLDSYLERECKLIGVVNERRIKPRDKHKQ